MDAKGRAELGGVMMRGSGLAPTLDGADLTSLQVGRYCWFRPLCWLVVFMRYGRRVFMEKPIPSLVRVGGLSSRVRADTHGRKHGFCCWLVLELPTAISYRTTMNVIVLRRWPAGSDFRRRRCAMSPCAFSP